MCKMENEPTDGLLEVMQVC